MEALAGGCTSGELPSTTTAETGPLSAARASTGIHCNRNETRGADINLFDESHAGYYGWRVVAALFVMLAASSGLGFYIHSVLITNLDFERQLASAAVALFFLVSGLTGPLVAMLLDRLDIRLVIGGGAIVGAIALGPVGQARTEWQLYGIYVVFGLGFCASGLLPASTLIARWFRDRRATALAIASTGLPVGGVVITPICAAFIERYGVAYATPWMGLAYVLGILPICWWVLRTPTGERPGSVVVEASIGLGAALRHRYFWSLSVAYIFIMFAQVGGITHQYGLINERMSADMAIYALAVMPFFAIVGRLGGGLILNRFSTRGFTMGMIVAQSAALFAMALGPPVLLMAGLALFGLTVGNLLMLQSLLIAEIYGLDHYARIYSWSTLFSMLGLAAGPAVMGFAYGLTGNYVGSFMLGGLSGLLAVIAFIPTQYGGPVPPVPVAVTRVP